MRIIISVLVIFLNLNTALAHSGHEHSQPKTKLEGVFNVLQDKKISIDSDSAHIADLYVKKAIDRFFEYKLTLESKLDEDDGWTSINKGTTTYDNLQEVIYYSVVNFANDKTYTFMINFKNFDSTNNGSMTVFSVNNGSFLTESIRATVKAADD